MEYKVTHKLYATPELLEEARRGLEEYNSTSGYPPLPFVETDEISIIADDEVYMKAVLWQDYGIGSDMIVNVEVVRDDSQELVKDTELLALADKQPTCARYDWTSEQAVAFARDAIAAHMAKLGAKQ